MNTTRSPLIIPIHLSGDGAPWFEAIKCQELIPVIPLRPLSITVKANVWISEVWAEKQQLQTHKRAFIYVITFAICMVLLRSHKRHQPLSVDARVLYADQSFAMCFILLCCEQQRQSCSRVNLCYIRQEGRQLDEKDTQQRSDGLLHNRSKFVTLAITMPPFINQLATLHYGNNCIFVHPGSLFDNRFRLSINATS